MDFFYNLNKKIAELSTKTEREQIAESKTAAAVANSPLTNALDEASYSAKAARAGKDIGKPGKAFGKIAADAGKRYGSKAAGERVAGAVLNKLRHPKEEKEMDESALQAYLGDKKYGKAGMDALRKAGREHASKEKMAKIRAKYDKMDKAEATCNECGMHKSKCECSSMEEGNAFTGALAKTPKGGKFKVGGKEFTDTSNLEELDMRLLRGAQDSMKGSNTDTESERNRHKKYGYRNDRDDTGNDSDYDEYGNLKNKKKTAVSDGPTKKGRPAKEKQQERVTANSYKYKQGRTVKTKEGLDSDGVMMTRSSNMSSESFDHGEEAEYNDEVGMTKDSLHTIVRRARELERALRDNENMPEWVQEKIGQIKGMMSSVTDYIISTHEHDAEQHMGREDITIEPVTEKSVSQAQARMMAGAAHSPALAKKVGVATKVAKEFNKADTGKDISKLPKKVKKTDEANDGSPANNNKSGNIVAGRIGKDKQGGKAKKAKEEKVDETTTSGSVAPVQNAAPKDSKGMQFGKGVYESLDQQFKQALTEDMNVSVNMSTDEHGQLHKNVTVSAEGKDAEALARLLKMAGLGGQDQYKTVCSSCGKSNCGCQEIDENSPDWPTNTETLAADPNLRTYSGGLNGPKSTGQSTTIGGGLPNLQPRRQTSMEESIELEHTLFKTWQKYKG